MNVAILSFTESTKRLYKKLICERTINDIQIIKLDQGFSEKGYKDTSILSIFEARNLIKHFDYLLVPPFIAENVDILDTIEQIEEMGFSREKILIVPIEVLLGKDRFSLEQCISVENYNYLDYLEISICDFCNLNCKGCSHFSNLIMHRDYPNFREFKKDFTQLKKIIPHISKIRIMGGEPFLNKDLPRYIRMIKNIYPFTDLRVCTNGLLLLKQDENVLEVLRENKVMLDISVYPPMFDKISSILEKLNEFEIKYYYEIITKFKPILLGNEREYYYTELTNCNCINLKNGCLASCPVIFYIDYYNRMFNKNYPNDGGKIDIYSTKLRGRQVIEELKKPFELCNYCAHHREDLPFFKWERIEGNFNKDDWISKED